MPPQHEHGIQDMHAASYSPQSHDRRRGSRADDDGPTTARAWWRRPTEIMAACALIAVLASAASAFGIRFLPATRAVEAEAIARQTADTTIQRRVDHNSDRIDALATQVKDLSDRLLFTNYMQCMSFKQTNGGPLPAECTRIIERRLSP